MVGRAGWSRAACLLVVVLLHAAVLVSALRAHDPLPRPVPAPPILLRPLLPAPPAATPALPVAPVIAKAAPVLIPPPTLPAPAKAIAPRPPAVLAQTAVPVGSAPPQRTALVPPTASSALASRAWQAELSAWLLAHRVYPPAARAGGVQGAPVIRFSVAHDGQVTAVALVRTGGSSLLDEAALALLRHAHLPPMPAGMAAQSVTVSVAIRYSLR